ncbi:hypothetical protein [Microbacterium hominis]|uniref:hypothetical protein n=1 Tax=Microbacterium hominis TaxID=162426 RepID=UPI001F05E2CE|nr:hypothetical protein [Microbacterium hominis]
MPVALPVVAMAVHSDGTMTVTVDGAPHLPEPFAPPWERASFAEILDQLTARHRVPLRVEVREVDGSTFTDIITPTRRANAPPASAHAPEPAPASADLLTLTGTGFVPGEDVAVAVIIAHSDAAPDGTARALIPRAQLAQAPTGEVILLGRVSGTLAVRQPR